MVIILVHWLIRKGSEGSFIETWKGMTVKKGRGLYREILTQPILHDNPKFNMMEVVRLGLGKSIWGI